MMHYIKTAGSLNLALLISFLRVIFNLIFRID